MLSFVISTASQLGEMMLLEAHERGISGCSDMENITDSYCLVLSVLLVFCGCSPIWNDISIFAMLDEDYRSYLMLKEFLFTG